MAPGDSETAATPQAAPELVEPEAKPDEPEATELDEQPAAEHSAAAPTGTAHSSADHSAADDSSPTPSATAAPEHPSLEHDVPAHGSPAHEAPAHDTPAHTPNGSGGGSYSAAAAAATAPLVESSQIRRAIAIAQKRTDLNWSVFIGTLGRDPRAQAEARHAELGPAAAKSVLIAVDPAAHHLEIVTGTHARKHLDDRSCALAAAAMTSSFAVRDLDGGIAYGILAMVEHVRSVR